MEPIGFLVGVVGLIQASTPYFQSLYHSKEERAEIEDKLERLIRGVKDLRRHVKDVQSIANSINGPFDRPENYGQRLQRYRDSENELKGLDRRLRTFFEDSSKEPQTTRERWKRGAGALVWHFRKPRRVGQVEAFIYEINRLQEDLKRDDSTAVHENTRLARKNDNREEEKKVQKILDWISPCPLQSEASGAYQNAYFADDFVKHNDIYLEWATGPSQQCRHLNCFGDPGSGKSFRVNAVIRDLKDRFSQGHVPVLSVVFQQAMSTNQSVSHVLCSLLRQCYSQSATKELPEQLCSIFQESKLGGKRVLNEDEAYEFLTQELEKSPRSFIIFDGIDKVGEYKEAVLSEIKKLRKNLRIRIFTTDQQDPRETNDVASCSHCGEPDVLLYWQCKICPGARDIQGSTFDLCKSCYQNKGLRCRDDTHEMKLYEKSHVRMSVSDHDIETFVTGSIDRALKSGDSGDEDDNFYSSQSLHIVKHWKTLSPDQQDAVPSWISQKADKSYLIANLYVERLVGEPMLHDFEAAIQELQDSNLSSTLDYHYKRLITLCLQQPERFKPKVAYNHLSLLACAVDVLSFQQLSHASAVRPGDRYIGDFESECCDMQLVRKRTRALLSLGTTIEANLLPVTFYHSSLTEYLNRHYTDLFPDADQKMFGACMAYFELDVFRTPFETPSALSDALEQYPFVKYAANYWGTHARRVSQSTENMTAILKLLADTDRFDCVMQIAWQTRAHLDVAWDADTGVSPLHVCAFHGLDKLCQELIDGGQQIDIPNYFGATPLHYACRKGFHNVAKVLLDAGADVNAVSDQGQTPLMEAIRFGHDDVVDLLISLPKCDVNKEGGSTIKNTALMSTLSSNPQAFAKLLGRADIDVNKQDACSVTILMWAIWDGRLDVVEKLLSRRDLDLSLRDESGRGAVDVAAENATYDVAAAPDILNKLLADARTPEMLDDSLLNLIQDMQFDLVQRVLNRRNRKCWADRHGRTYLHIAAGTGSKEITQMVLGYFSNTSPLDLKSIDRMGWTALHTACSRISSDSSAAAFLLGQYANAKVKDSLGNTPLDIARQNSRIERSADIDDIFRPYVEKDYFKQTPLGYQSLKSKVIMNDIELVRQALDGITGRIPVEKDAYTGRTLLHLTMNVDPPHTKMLGLLLEKSDQDMLDATDDVGGTCLHEAAGKHCMDAVRLLIAAGADLDKENTYNRTAFMIAQQQPTGYSAAVTLAAAGAKLPASRKIKKDLLHQAIRDRNLKAVDVLLHAGVDPYSVEGNTGPRAFALAENKFTIAKNKAHNRMWGTAQWKEKYSNDEEREKAILMEPDVQTFGTIVERLRKAEQDFARTSCVDPSVSSRQLNDIIDRLAKRQPTSVLTTAGEKTARLPAKKSGKEDLVTRSREPPSVSPYPVFDSPPGLRGYNITIIDLKGAGGIAWAASFGFVATLWLLLHYQVSFIT